MKQRLLPIVILVAALAGWSCDSSPFSPGDRAGNSNATASERFSFEKNAAGHTGLRLEGVNGSVTITGSAEADSVVITGEKRVGSDSTADAQAHLQELEVLVSDLGSEIFVETVQPRDSQGRNYIVDYTITVPREFDVRAHNINGAIDVRDVHGNVSVDLINGSIGARLSLPANGTIDMATVNGMVQLDIPEATSAQLTADVVNGIINLTNLDLHNSVSSRTSLRGTLGEGRGRVSLRTTNGNIGVAGF